MKKTGRGLVLLTLMLAVMLSLPAVFYASSTDSSDIAYNPSGNGSPVVYAVSTRENAGGNASGPGAEDVWKYDYIALNEDGTGIFLYNQAAFTIRWEWDGTTFSFTDHKGYQFTGTYDGSSITGVYGNYRYEFVRGDWTLPVWTLSPDNWGKDLSPVTDQAQKLTDQQMDAFTKKAQALSDEYDVGVYIVLVANRDDYTWSGGIETLSEEIRSGYRIGIGPTEKKSAHIKSTNEDWKDSILLTVAFDVRNYDICVSGDYGTWAFPTYAREKNRDGFVDDFKENEWAEGIEDYLNGVEKALKSAAKGHPLTFKYDTTGRMIGIFVPILLALIFGYGIAAVMRGSMQNTQMAKNAASYVAGDKVNFTRREDRYIRTIVSRVYSPKEKSSSGGGGGFSSSGSSHTSGSF